MSRLNELITELCPDGVEYKALHEVSYKIVDGMHSLPKNLAKSGIYPVISAQNINNGLIDLITNKYANSEIFEKENKRTCVHKGDLLLTIVGAIGRTAVVDDQKMLFQRSVCVITPKEIINPKFLKYSLDSTPVQEWMRANAHGAAQKGLYLKQVEKIMIPVPPLPVQEKIVQILDTFTVLTAELIAELTDELEARKKQYESYRNEMLTFDSNIPFKTLEEICNISAGGDAPKDSMAKRKNDDYYIPIISNGIGENAFYGYTNVPKISEPAVTVAARGTIGYAEYRDYPFFPIIRLLSVIPKNTNELRTKFLYYCLQGKKYNVPTSGIPQLTAPMLKRVEIPIPEVEVQERIVNTLDYFDALCNDISARLLAEMETRQKQFEYYRDKLLSF